jgi:peptidoglycan hydrolase-like protein with peptidoglycan-binding domain
LQQILQRLRQSVQPTPLPKQLVPVPKLLAWLCKKRLMPHCLDGKAGASTIAALRAFQKSKGLKADGVFGMKTRAALSMVAFTN